MDQIMETMVTMAIMATMGTMETMEITTTMVIILTSMVHQRLQSSVEMVMDLMEMAMGPMEMAPTEMDQMEMDPMEMEMDLTTAMEEMETDPMVCAARSPAQSANQSGSQSARTIPLPAVKKCQPKYPPQSQLRSVSRSPPRYAEM